MWNIITTETRRELGVAGHLVGNGVRVYCPTYRRRVRAAPMTGRKWRQTDQPLYPGYVFAVMDSGAAWDALRQTPGAWGVLKSSGTPAELTETAIDLIRQFEAELGIQMATEERGLLVGDTVRVADRQSLWQNYLGVVAKLDKRDRVTLLLITPANSGLRVTVPGKWLELASETAASSSRGASGGLNP